MTTSKATTLRHNLNFGNPAIIASAAEKMKLGNALSKIKVVATGLTPAASFDITTAAVKAASTITGITLDSGENLPPIGVVVALRTTGGTTPQAQLVTDAGGTAAAATALLSDDGKTLTFGAADHTGFVLEYYPAPDVALSTSFPVGAPANF